MFLALHLINYLSNSLISEMIAKYMENIKNNEEITMSEFMPMFLKFATEIQQDINDIQRGISDLKKEVNQRFDKIDQTLSYHETWLKGIESTMVKKNNFDSLVKILERKEIISKYEAAHCLYTG